MWYAECYQQVLMVFRNLKLNIPFGDSFYIIHQASSLSSSLASNWEGRSTEQAFSRHKHSCNTLSLLKVCTWSGNFSTLIMLNEIIWLLCERMKSNGKVFTSIILVQRTIRLEIGLGSLKFSSDNLLKDSALFAHIEEAPSDADSHERREVEDFFSVV